MGILNLFKDRKQKITHSDFVNEIIDLRLSSSLAKTLGQGPVIGIFISDLLNEKFSIRADYNSKMIDSLYQNPEVEIEYIDSFTQKIFVSVFIEYFLMLNSAYDTDKKEHKVLKQEILSWHQSGISVSFSREVSLKNCVIGNFSIHLSYLSLTRNFHIDIRVVLASGKKIYTTAQTTSFPISYAEDIKNFENGYKQCMAEIIRNSDFLKFIEYNNIHVVNA